MKREFDIVCVVGPTASGKTGLAVELAERMHTEIISADSVQVYRELDIGSAKPTKEEMRSVRHHMIDCIDVDTPSFSVSEYTKAAFPIAEKLLADGKVPIVVGGSGLYINAFTTPLHFAAPGDPIVRATLEAEYDTDPVAFTETLKRVDPVSGNRLHKNDKKRLVRAMEVFRLTGKPISEYGSDFQNTAGVEPPFRAVRIGLTCDRDTLYRRINERVDQMIASGLVEEARNIYNKGYSKRLPAMQSIGYRQLFDAFDGTCSLEEAIEAIKQETRRFAKRQITWFKRDKEIHWLDCANSDFDSLTSKALEIIYENTEKR